MPIIDQALKDAKYPGQQDLQTIYRDAPEWLFTPFPGENDLIESALADGSLIAEASTTACSVPVICKGTTALGICPIYACEELPNTVGSQSDW